MLASDLFRSHLSLPAIVRIRSLSTRALAWLCLAARGRARFARSRRPLMRCTATRTPTAACLVTLPTARPPRCGSLAATLVAAMLVARGCVRIALSRCPLTHCATTLAPMVACLGALPTARLPCRCPLARCGSIAAAAVAWRLSL